MLFTEHPLRRQVVSEMHLRRWPPISAPLLAIQVLRLVDAEERAAEAEVLRALPPGWTLAPTDSPRHHEGRCGPGWQWVWEHHAEGSGFTLFVPGPPAQRMLDPASDPALAEAIAWIGGLPGKVIRAVRIAVLPDEDAAAPVVAGCAFHADELVSCRIGRADGPRARIWSDFRIADDVFGRLVVAANGLPPFDLSRLIQRLQELGNYRNLALLGLPAAREGWQALDRIEGELTRLSAQVSRADVTDDALLEGVSALSLDLMSQATAGRYRMSATAAYATLVDERLDELAPEPIAGFQSLADFTRRRLLPAVRTCAAHSMRERELSDRAATFVALLRTRIETRMENQNAEALASMKRSTGLQLRMQQLVEGLSIVALSYYSIGLLGYLLKGIEAADHSFPAYQMLALMTPVVMIAVAIGLNRIKRKVLGPDHGAHDHT